MLISSREELAKIINNHTVDTYVVKDRKDVKIMHNIVYDEEKDLYYRVEWGEITDERNIKHLWYNEKADKVYLNRSITQRGWCAKNETNTGIEEGVDLSEHRFYRVEKNIVRDIETPAEQFSNLKNLTVWGTKTGKGKTSYAILKSVKKMIEGESVLFFSTETTELELIRRMAVALESLGADVNSTINNSNLKIVNSFNMGYETIIKEMEKYAASEEGSKFVVIDHLHLQNGIGGNYNYVVDIHRKIDEKAIELGCEVLVTTQLNREAKLN